MKSSTKVKTTFVCENCGSNFSSWYGKCPDCGEWNTLKEFKINNEKLKVEKNIYKDSEKTNFVKLGKTNKASYERLTSGFEELDRVLGGGFVKDEVILLAGQPGIGKSTFILSILDQNSKTKQKEENKTIYISTEEEISQINNRCERLEINTKNILFTSQKNIDSLIIDLEELINKNKRSISLIVFDSLQGLYSTNSESLPGSISQSKEVLMRIVQLVKAHGITALVIGHVTKGGEIAGPKFLEHMVDCVLFMEGENLYNLRILRAFKNRFGPTNEVGFFKMTEKGMQQVSNPSAYFLEWNELSAGKASIGIRQGQRIVFATIETLVVASSLAFPKRVAKGIDYKRLELILAILKKYLNLKVDKFDIYVSVSGGLQVKDPLADLGIAAALYSSLVNKILCPKTLFLGEVGLLGTVRKSSFTSLISKEAKRLGFTKIFSSKNFSRITQLKSLK